MLWFLWDILCCIFCNYFLKTANINQGWAIAFLKMSDRSFFCSLKRAIRSFIAHFCSFTLFLLLFALSLFSKERLSDRSFQMSDYGKSAEQLRAMSPTDHF